MIDEFFCQLHKHTRIRKIQVLLRRVEHMSFRLLVRLFSFRQQRNRRKYRNSTGLFKCTKYKFAKKICQNFCFFSTKRLDNTEVFPRWRPRIAQLYSIDCRLYRMPYFTTLNSTKDHISLWKIIANAFGDKMQWVRFIVPSVTTRRKFEGFFSYLIRLPALKCN